MNAQRCGSDKRRDRDGNRREFLGAAVAAAWVAKATRVHAADAAPQFLLQWGTRGSEPGQFSACVGIAIGTDDTIYTSEFRNQRVQCFAPDGKLIRAFDVQPHAGGLAVDQHRNVYVGHWNSNKVAVYGPDGKLLREWGERGTQDGQFQLPGSVALGADGLLYVPDQGNSRIQKFTTVGQFVGKWGSRGSEPGQFGGQQPEGGRFAGPQFVAFDAQGNVYATDAALDRVQQFTPDGELLRVWGSGGSQPGGFGPPPVDKSGQTVQGGPIGVCVDRQGNVWVSATNHRVQQFTRDGQFLRSIGADGSEPGQFHFPHAIAFDSQGHLYVADTMNSRIQKFAV